ncbi:hypothetical protein jhhlp_003362 [Lomentospora prolificans]|uniref:Exoribonuclease phosphorolytic domain-containing protein n=1 Tax=Lomentospora prolificans TaxID=41688 RepID=A0A2N3NGR9_9PEZI|nr:hypothetical protein jhhlp_003362 [Lomentospora prolificans]
MADRRRINGPSGVTSSPVYENAGSALGITGICGSNPRHIFLKTGVTPSASGSAYLEIGLSQGSGSVGPNGMKLICTVHGPRALPRSGPFSPHLILTTHVKFAPFASRQRRSYLRDSSERDLGVHLETALRGALIADRWPKSAVDVVVTIIESDQDIYTPNIRGYEIWNLVHTLSACITVASAAFMDAGIDCVDSVSGGAATLVSSATQDVEVQLTPLPQEPSQILAACCVAYLPSRDEMTALWIKGHIPPPGSTHQARLIATAIQAAKASKYPLVESLTEAL